MRSNGKLIRMLVCRWSSSLTRGAGGCCGQKPPRRGAGRGGGGGGGSDMTDAALATYVAPGDLDEYYLFYSGGHSGQIFVAGIPSMRHIATIPVFTPYPGTGYGFDDEIQGDARRLHLG